MYVVGRRECNETSENCNNFVMEQFINKTLKKNKNEIRGNLMY